MKLSQLFENCPVTYDKSFENIDIGSVVTSSERVTAGSLFAAIKGLRHDGYDSVNEAAHRGAVCILSDRRPAGGVKVPVVLTDDVRKTVALALSNFYGRPDRKMKTAAITGTNGKTTTALILEHILRRAGYSVGVMGTLGITLNSEHLLSEKERAAYSMTTPDPEILYRSLHMMKEKGCDAVVLEASSHALELRKLDGLRIDVGAFTNLTPEHLDFHHDMESYYLAKRRLCEMSDRFIVNIDDPFGKRLWSEFPSSRGISCVPENAADENAFATAVVYRDSGFNGIEYMYYSKKAIFEIKSPMWGKNALYNTMCAASIALELGVDASVISDALRSFRGVKGRLEEVCSGKGMARVIIDYAHTPDALEKALATVKGLMAGRGRLILVFGCGGDRDTEKRSVMGRIAEKNADYTFVTSDNPRNEDPEKIISMIKEGMGDISRYTCVTDRREALCKAIAMSRAGDVVLVCGKGHEEYIIDKRGKRPFPEREIILNAVREKYPGVSI